MNEGGDRRCLRADHMAIESGMPGFYERCLESLCVAEVAMHVRQASCEFWWMGLTAQKGLMMQTGTFRQ